MKSQAQKRNLKINIKIKEKIKRITFKLIKQLVIVFLSINYFNVNNFSSIIMKIIKYKMI